MGYDPFIHHRRSIRLKNYDYSQQGAYYVTICTQYRICHFGDVHWDEVRGAFVKHNEIGGCFQAEWRALPGYFTGLEIDIYELMPNHLHGVLLLPEDQTYSLCEVIERYKSWTTTLYCRNVHAGRWPPFEKRLWHRNYWKQSANI